MTDVFSPERTRARWLLGIGLQGLGWMVYGVIYYHTQRPYTPFDDIVMQQAAWAAASGLVFSAGLGWSYAKLRVPQRSPVWAAAAVLAGSTGIGWVWARVNQWGADRIDPFEAPVYPYAGLLPGQESLLVRTEAFPLVLLVWSGFYLGLTYWYERQVQQQRVLQADAEAQRARLQMLRYQLNPHFFFNALNTIGALAEERPRRVKEVVHELSGFLRYSLLDDDVVDVPLRKEVRAAEQYFAVEQMRFEDDLAVTVDVAPSARHRPVPAFLVLPLVENAVKHGQHTSPSPLRVRLTATVCDGRLAIEVANTGRLRAEASEANSTGTGLGNVRARLRARYPDRHRFALSERDGWVRARIEIDTDALDAPSSHV